MPTARTAMPRPFLMFQTSRYSGASNIRIDSDQMLSKSDSATTVGTVLLNKRKQAGGYCSDHRSYLSTLGMMRSLMAVGSPGAT